MALRGDASVVPVGPAARMHGASLLLILRHVYTRRTLQGRVTAHGFQATAPDDGSAAARASRTGREEGGVREGNAIRARTAIAEVHEEERQPREDGYRHGSSRADETEHAGGAVCESTRSREGQSAWGVSIIRAPSGPCAATGQVRTPAHGFPLEQDEVTEVHEHWPARRGAVHRYRVERARPLISRRSQDGLAI